MATREVSDGTRTTDRWTNEGTAGYYTGNPLAWQRALTTAEAADLAAIDAGNARLTNHSTLTDKATRATAANIADIAACDAISGAAAFTATQRDNAIRELARQSAVQARQLNVLIKLQLEQLDDTTGT